MYPAGCRHAHQVAGSWHSTVCIYLLLSNYGQILGLRQQCEKACTSLTQAKWNCNSIWLRKLRKQCKCKVMHEAAISFQAQIMSQNHKHMQGLITMQAFLALYWIELLSSLTGVSILHENALNINHLFTFVFLDLSLVPGPGS